MGNLAGTVVDSGVSLEDGIVTDIKALLREAAAEIRASVEAEYGHSLQYPSYRLNYDAGMELPVQLEAAAEGLGEPVAWLAQHPKYMPEPCVEIASSDYHAPDIMEREEAQGWNFTPLYTAGTNVDSDQNSVQFTAYLEDLLEQEREKVRVLRERLQPFAKFACSPAGECDCQNCAAREALATTTEQGE